MQSRMIAEFSHILTKKNWQNRVTFQVVVDLSQRKFIGYGDNGDIFRGNFAEKKRGVKHFPIKKATRRFCFPNFL